MQPNDSSVQYGKVSSIYPYYKPDNIFERDQAYYDQLQKNTRRPQNSLLPNSQSSQRPQYQQVQTQYNNYYPQQQGQYGYQSQQNRSQSNVQNFPINFGNPSQFEVQDLGYINQSFGQHNESQSPTFSRVQDNSQLNPNSLGYSVGPNNPNNPSVPVYNNNQNSAQNLAYGLGLSQMNNVELTHSPVNQQNQRVQSEENRQLKQRLDDLINYRDHLQDGSEVKKKHHYNKDSNEGRTIMNQQTQIQKLLQQVKKNNMDIGRYRNAIVELQKSTNNIQSVDRQIYRQLKNLSNRDQELLDRATTALARGASREQVAGILERIIS